MSRDICIVGIMVDHRATRGPEVQEVLTRYGDSILSRSGIPDPTKGRGIISLTLQVDENGRKSLEKDLHDVPGVSVNSMILGPVLQ